MAKISKAFLRIKIFIDSDVIIASLISKTGASNIIVNHSASNNFISNFSIEELERTVDKLGVDKSKLEGLIKSSLKILNVQLDKDEVLDRFGKYTYDIEDAHIVAGAKAAKARFLVTFNIRDYKIQKIGQELNIRVILPGELLEYLRSIS